MRPKEAGNTTHTYSAYVPIRVEMAGLSHFGPSPCTFAMTVLDQGLQRGEKDKVYERLGMRHRVPILAWPCSIERHGQRGAQTSLMNGTHVSCGWHGSGESERGLYPTSVMMQQMIVEVCMEESESRRPTLFHDFSHQRWRQCSSQATAMGSQALGEPAHQHFTGKRARDRGSSLGTLPQQGLRGKELPAPKARATWGPLKRSVPTYLPQPRRIGA